MILRPLQDVLSWQEQTDAFWDTDTTSVKIRYDYIQLLARNKKNGAQF